MRTTNFVVFLPYLHFGHYGIDISSVNLFSQRIVGQRDVLLHVRELLSSHTLDGIVTFQATYVWPRCRYCKHALLARYLKKLWVSFKY